MVTNQPLPPDETSPVPPTLRAWFQLHCAIDVLAAIPLLLMPAKILGLLGWTSIDPVSARLVGAALMGIGVASVTVHRHGLPGYRTLLSLKIVWSVAAIFGLLAGIAEGAPPAAWALLSIFIAFSGVWMSYAIRLRQLARLESPSQRDTHASDDTSDDNTSDDSDDDDSADRDVR